MTLWVVTLSLALSFVTRSIYAYPVLMQIDEGAERCFQFQIPMGDDANLVAVVLPSEEEIPDEKVESWYFDQVYKLTKAKNDKNIIPREFPEEMPGHVAAHMSEYHQKTQGGGSPLIVTLTNRPADDDKKHHNQYTAKVFKPLVVNFISRTTNARSKRKGWANAEDAEIDGYGLCVQNRDDEKYYQIVLDIVLISEDVPNDLDQADGFSVDSHLTPLEESLKDSITSAENILREMRYMEQREQRMRKTTDSINSRVHWFSYLSVSILLAVTYIQVTYLKRYFHKKKLM
ncbi:hypothetical protein FisN_9Lh220 [Fistulifera solaris]|uniref:GOLD domain-containing protein n=1 Tax=Fistulifera solaris TaxID=1519565 RepID=A0A1Z5KKR8_FISSO|nr:hypothetical protein FisN_9Lh220 [Fistulifera solaris]|eukprot:GAX26920.1 hypothetical protein FisN_9Lh220 [Fistulifera solaris]